MKKLIALAVAVLALSSCATAPSKGAAVSKDKEQKIAVEKTLLKGWADAILKAESARQRYEFAKECGDEDLMKIYGDAWNAEQLRARRALAEYLVRTER